MNYFSLNKLVTTLGVRRILEFRTMKTKTIINAEGKDVIKKKVYENRITLISPDNSLSITDLKNAQNISLRRDLKLVKIQDTDAKTRRPVYKLMTSSEYHAEELSKRKEKQLARQNASIKGEKLLTLSSRIGEHDLMTGIKKMLKLVEKQYEVKVVIAGDDAEAAMKSEKIYQTIENQVRNMSRIVQKRVKGNSLRFQLLPVRDSSTEGTGNTDSSQNDNNKGPL
ncbi:hypothetical protein SFRURICE_019955 [Spodoptera frugiperda]|uniref:SFRICE_002820 n=1 Tax=Spodoptera frugiperda TaxID=7108 RepID=A0A2H1V649_SPOFR|nr:hypothetical protein SFRURICE_019955 [Spodoptera frugiperda]